MKLFNAFSTLFLFPILSFSAPVVPPDVPLPSTPLSVILDFKQVDAAASVTTIHSLYSPTDAFTRGLPMAHVSSTSQPVLQKLLSSPLQSVIDDLWTSLNSNTDVSKRPATLISEAIRRGEPKAYAITPTLPSKGVLYARVENTDNVFNGITYKANKLVLTYKLSGMSSTFNLPNPLVGNWADPRMKMTFDGMLVVKLTVPDTPTQRMLVLTEFKAVNVLTTEDTFWSGVERVWADIAKSIANIVLGDVTTNVPIAGTSTPLSINGLFNGLAELFKALGEKYSFDKLSIGLQQPTGQPVNNKVEIVVSHSTRPGPEIGSTGSGSNVKSSISLIPNQLHPGDRLTVSGNTEAVQRSTTAGIFGSVQLPQTVEVEYGVSKLNIPGVTFPDHLHITPRQILTFPRAPPTSKTRKTISRDARGVAYITGLTPSEWYGVRARTYDAAGVIATEWGKWYYLRTASTDISTINILNAAGSIVATGAANIYQSGAFSTSITIPIAGPPGTYKAVASIPEHASAEASFTLTASNTALTPTIYSKDYQGNEVQMVGVWAGRPTTFYGRNWGASSAIEITMEGKVVGSTWSSFFLPPNGVAGLWQADLKFPDLGAASNGYHEVIARQKSTGMEARCKIWYLVLH